MAFRPEEFETTTRQPQTFKPQGGRGGPLTAFISEALGTVGGVGGFLLGGPAGAAAGAAGLGGLGSALEQQIRDGKIDTGKAVTEGAIEGLFAGGPLRLGKVALGTAKGLQAGGKAGAKAGFKEATEAFTKQSFLNRNFKKTAQKARDVASTNILGLTPSRTAKLLDNGVDPNDLARVANQFGGDASEIIGRTGNKGPLQDAISALEDGIQTNVTNAGKNLRFDGSEVINKLKAERKILAKQLGGGSKVKQLDKVIADAQKKYAKGITARQARQILKEGNNRFGKSIVDDSTDAVITSAQKLEANTMRELLKDRFPGIKNALDNESLLIQTRELLKGARAKDVTGKARVGGFDFTRPGTFLDPFLNSNKVSRAALGSAPELPGAQGLAGQLARGVAGGTINSFSQEPQVDPAQGFGAPQLGANQLGGVAQGLPGSDQLGGEQLSAPAQTEQGLAQILSDPEVQLQLLLDNQGNDDALSFLSNLFSVAGEAQQSTGLDLNNTAITSITDLQSGLDQLDTLEQDLQTNTANNPILGRLRGMNPFDDTAGALQSKINLTKQIVGKALEGGVLRKEDEIKYAKILPTLGDTDGRALEKIALIRADIQNKLNNFIEGQRQFGGGAASQDEQSLSQALAGAL